MKRTSIRTLKQNARRLLPGNYSFLALITVVISFCSLVLSYLDTFAVPVIDGLFSLVQNFAFLLVINMICTLLQAGTYRLYLNLAQGQSLQFRDLFFAFENHPEPIAAFSLISLIVEYGFLYLAVTLVLPNPSAAFAVLSVIVGSFLLWFHLTYSAVLFLHASHPWSSIRELMRESRTLMRGHRLHFLLLELSFLGVLLLGLLSLGIGFLFVLPYRAMTHTLFYLDLQK